MDRKPTVVLWLMLLLSHAAAVQEDDEDEDEGDDEEPEAAGTAPAGAAANLDANAANGAAADAGDSPEGVNPQVPAAVLCQHDCGHASWALFLPGAEQRVLCTLHMRHAGTQLLLTYSRYTAWARVASSWRLTVVGDPMCLPVLQEIRRDAFWLQRRVSSAFGSMDAAEAQQLAEKIFRTLEVRPRGCVPLHMVCTAASTESGNALGPGCAAGVCMSMQSSTCLPSKVSCRRMSRANWGITMCGTLTPCACSTADHGE